MSSQSECQARIFSTTLKQSTLTLLLMIGVLLHTPASAQVLYGSLTGNVTDPNGAAVAGAKIEARNISAGIVQEATSDNNGIYRMVALLPGTYTIAIAAPGFARLEFQNIPIVVNTLRRVDARLTVAKVSESITVTTEAPLLQADKSDVHTDLSAQQIDSLPISSSVGGRNFQSLLRVVPGVGNLTEQNSAAANPQRAMSTNINGQSLQGIVTRIDGVRDDYPWLPGNVAFVPPAESVQTVNVTTNTYTAEQGSAGGAAVNVQIKSGTNQIHGSAFEFFTDHNLRTRNYFKTDPVRFPRKSKNIQHQFGGAIGGPIIKNKLFYFGDYQRTTQRGIGTPSLTLPTAAMRTGDFTAAGLPVIIDPTTGSQVSCDGVLNKICSDRIDPAAAKLVALMPALTSPDATTNNYVVNGTGELNMNVYDVKINYVPTDRTTYFGRYSMVRGGIFDPPTLGELGGDATNGGQLGNAFDRVYSIGLGGTHTFTPNLLADWNLGYSRLHLGATALDIGTPFGLDTLGISGTNGDGVPGNSGLYNGIPSFQISGVANLGNPNTGNPFVFRDNEWVANANLSWIRGKHNFRFGTEFSYQQVNHFQPQGSDGNFTTARGSFAFNGSPTAANPSSPSNPFNSFAQFLFGLPTRAGKAVLLHNPVALRWKQYSWYAQDQWQVIPKLTLTLGLRWEYYPFGYGDNGLGLPVFNPADGNVYIGGSGDVPMNSGVDAGKGMFLPRVGFAYRATPKTVIRAGYGISADPNNYHFLRNAYPSTITSDPAGGGSRQTPIISLTGTNAVGNLASLPVGLAPLIVPLPDISTGVIALPNGAGDRTWVRDFRRGYIQSFNFTVQQELAGVSIEAGYVGSRAVRPLANVNLNSSQICPISAFPDPVNHPWNAANCVADGYGRILNVNGHSWGGIGAMMPFGRNWYDSLQTKVSRRFKGGTQVGLAYTFSKSLNYTENEDLSGLFEHFPAYWPLNKARAGFDRPHNLQLYAIYELPFGHGQRWLTGGVGNAIAGGWQVNTVISRLSGTPFSVTGSGGLLNPAGSDGLNNTADLVGNYRVLNSKPWSGSGTCPQTDLSCHYFDPSVFQQPEISVFGNTHRNQFRGPGIFDADFSVFRDFKITERFTFQFRAEMFGLTNTPRFNNPNTGCAGVRQTPGKPASDPNCGAPSGGLPGAPSTSNFGAITATNGSSGSNSSTDGARTVWFAGKLIF